MSVKQEKQQSNLFEKTRNTYEPYHQTTATEHQFTDFVQVQTNAAG